MSQEQLIHAPDGAPTCATVGPPDDASIDARMGPLAGALQAAQATPLQNLSALLDEALAHVQQQRFVHAFRLLGAPLSSLWASMQATGLGPIARQACGEHHLMALVRQDPYTHRAATKPRGYAGDAVMMDHVYAGQAPEGTTAVGAGVFAATTRAPMGLSVLFRRSLLRGYIDDTVAAKDSARLLSVASGHCRELQGSLVEHPGFNGELVALDQDALSCDEVRRCQAAHRVTVLNQSVRDLLARGGDELGQFDLIYSAGLYDYLPEAMALRLTSRLLQLLRPGGRLLVANFVPGGSGRGYMELFMDWTLVVRDEASMVRLCQQAAAPGVHAISSFLDPHRNVVYVEMSRSAAP